MSVVYKIFESGKEIKWGWQHQLDDAFSFERSYIDLIAILGTSGCISAVRDGDAMQAQERTRIAGNGEQVRYTIPREGAVMWFDVAAIPADAPHPDNAHRFIDFLLDARVAAENTNAIRFPNGNRASQPQVQPELTNAAIFPDGDLAARLIPEHPKSEQYVRLRTRAWTRFRTGK